MAKTLSITIRPSALSGEYLTVSDAMHQVLDLVDAIEKSDADSSGARKIVWRLTNAHTNSPPFTVVAEPFPVSPEISISLEADRLVGLFSHSLNALLSGVVPDSADKDALSSMRRALQRNLNGVGETDIRLDDSPPIAITPTNAKKAIVALEYQLLAEKAEAPDLRRTEYGSIEIQVIGVTRWNGRPALVGFERLSEERVLCVLTDDLAEKLGPEHKWAEAWGDNRRLLVSGAMHYSTEGAIKRLDAVTAEELAWTDVPLAALRDIDILNGRSVRDHLSRVWGDDA